MGFLDRFLGHNKPTEFGAPRIPETWRHQQDWLNDWGPPLNIVVGESRHQKELREAAQCDGQCLRLVNVTLQPEPDNPVDSDAIKVLLRGVKIGYLRRELAAGIADGCAAHRLGVPTLVVAGIMRGGWKEQRSIGVHIWIDRTITSGPIVQLDDAEEFEVAWPPMEHELDVLST